LRAEDLRAEDLRAEDLRASDPRNAKELGFMNETPAAITLDSRPRLPRGVRLVHNEAQGGWVLLAPERVFKADAVSAEVLKRCTGEATFATIVDDLAAAYAAPRERILADVTTMLRGLADKRLLEL
jgi:pyrroloquinoline quinone biosynthesis protein D